MAWMIHQGSYRNLLNASQSNGVLVGFAESKQSHVDLSSVCYCYQPEYMESGRRHPEQWVIVDSSTPYLEIGYAEFSLSNERFYFDCQPNRFRQGTLSNWIFETEIRDTQTNTVTPAYIIASEDGYLFSRKREDGVYVGAGAWQLSDNLSVMSRNYLPDLSSSNISAQDMTIPCFPIGSYQTDPALSGLRPTLKIHFDCSFKVPRSGYTDMVYSTNRYPDGIYYKCFTDGPVTHRIGDKVYSGQLSGGNVFVWQGALTDAAGRPEYFIGQSQTVNGNLIFPELNPQPKQTFHVIYNVQTNDYRFSKYTSAGFASIIVTRSGDSIQMSYVVNDVQKWSVSLSYMARGIPVTYRFNGLRTHIDPQEKMFLKGDQFTIDI